MNSSFLKNPVMKNKLEVQINNPAGNILEEISEQDTLSQVGGLSPAIVSLTAAIATIVSVATGGIIKDASANSPNPGRYCTISAECFAGKSCG